MSLLLVIVKLVKLKVWWILFLSKLYLQLIQ